MRGIAGEEASEFVCTQRCPVYVKESRRALSDTLEGKCNGKFR